MSTNKNHAMRKIKLLRTGLTEADVARMLMVTPQAVNNEMRGALKSSRIREALSRITKTPQDKLFPERNQEADRVA